MYLTDLRRGKNTRLIVCVKVNLGEILWELEFDIYTKFTASGDSHGGSASVAVKMKEYMAG